MYAEEMINSEMQCMWMMGNALQTELFIWNNEGISETEKKVKRQDKLQKEENERG